MFMTRGLATDACRAGSVEVGGVVAKPAREVRVGEVVVCLGERKTKVDNTGAPTEDDNLNLCLKGVMDFKRVVWVQLYSIPSYACNEIFFKLCIFYCGNFLRADTCTIEKERPDYA
jgi:hypothetical protein